MTEGKVTEALTIAETPCYRVPSPVGISHHYGGSGSRGLIRTGSPRVYKNVDISSGAHSIQDQRLLINVFSNLL
jgi:hypothetical protein